MQKWSSIVIDQYLCTSIWDLKYTFSQVNFAWTLFRELEIVAAFKTNCSCQCEIYNFAAI